MTTYHLCWHQGVVRELMSCFATYTHISLKFRLFLEIIPVHPCIYYHGLLNHWSDYLKETQPFDSPISAYVISGVSVPICTYWTDSCQCKSATASIEIIEIITKCCKSTRVRQVFGVNHGRVLLVKYICHHLPSGAYRLLCLLFRSPRQCFLLEVTTERLSVVSVILKGSLLVSYTPWNPLPLIPFPRHLFPKWCLASDQTAKGHSPFQSVTEFFVRACEKVTLT